MAPVVAVLEVVALLEEVEVAPLQEEAVVALLEEAVVAPLEVAPLEKAALVGLLVEVQLEVDNNWHSSRFASVEKDVLVSAHVVGCWGGVGPLSRIPRDCRGRANSRCISMPGLW